MDTDFVSIAAEDIVVVDIVAVDIEQDDTEAALVHLASAHHFSLSRCPSYFLTVAEVLCSLLHHDLLIYKIYNTD